MARKSIVAEYLECPMCDCELPMTGDEKPGDEIFCQFCETPLKVRKNKEDDSFFLQEDF